MSSPEVRRPISDFMGLDDFVELVNNNLALVVYESDAPDGCYEKLEALEDLPEEEPQFIVKLHGMPNEVNPLSFLRQLEWIRRELRDGEVPKEGSMERLFGDIEIEMGASRFYEAYGNMVDFQVKEGY